MSITISVRLPENIASNLADVASETERSKSFHIQKAVEMYLEEFADVQIALDRLRDKDDPLISSEELIEKKEKERILTRIEDTLSKRPYQYPLLKGRFAGLRKLRIGNYRVIFSLFDDEIWILRIGYRSEVYK